VQRARIRLGAALVGFLVAVTELSLALYSEVSFPGTRAQQSTFVPSSPLPERVVFHLPAALLALASVVGGVALYCAIRGRSRWSWYAAALAPVAALLVIHKPPVTHGLLPLYVKDAVLPWAAPWYWTHMGVGGAATSLLLQIAMYLAAVTYVLAIILAIPIDNHEGSA
jgi:hypothetical protein